MRRSQAMNPNSSLQQSAGGRVDRRRQDAGPGEPLQVLQLDADRDGAGVQVDPLDLLVRDISALFQPVADECRVAKRTREIASPRYDRPPVRHDASSAVPAEVSPRHRSDIR